MAKHRTVGPMPAGTIVDLEQRRLVHTAGSHRKEYIGIVAHLPDTGEFIGYAHYGRIGTAGQNALYYRGPSRQQAHTRMLEVLHDKVWGRSNYRTDDGLALSALYPIVDDDPDDRPPEPPADAGEGNDKTGSGNAAPPAGAPQRPRNARSLLRRR